MPDSTALRRPLLVTAAAILSAAISDCLIENGAQLGLYGQSFADHDQRSILCTATAGLALVCASALVFLLERLRAPLSPGRDWLADAAHRLATSLSWRAFPPALLVAFLVRYAMESAEVLQQTGHLATGLGWLGGPLVIGLAVHAVCCALALVGLAVVMRSLDRTVQALIAAIFALFSAFVMLIGKRPVRVRRDRRRAVFRPSPLARLLGERGPPSFVAA